MQHYAVMCNVLIFFCFFICYELQIHLNSRYMVIRRTDITPVAPTRCPDHTHTLISIKDTRQAYFLSIYIANFDEALSSSQSFWYLHLMFIFHSLFENNNIIIISILHLIYFSITIIRKQYYSILVKCQ